MTTHKQQKLVEIVAITVDTREAVLYHRDGSTTTIQQGDKRLPGIVKEAQEQIPETGYAIVDIGEEVSRRAEFNDVEQGTGGLIKFFKVAKKAVADFFAPSPEKVTETAHVRPVDIGIKPGEEPVEVHIDPLVEAGAAVQQALEAKAEPPLEVKEIVAKEVATKSNDQILDETRDRMNALIGNGKGTDTPEFHKRLQDDETIVAVNTATGAILPEAQKLSPQFKIAAKLQNYKGIENFMKRLEPVLKDRRHSAADLMHFLEKGDLPIADDGCIVIFKRLETATGGYVDVHSRKVKQKVGSFVFMREGLVDPNRRQDCSNGLHVASLSYLSQFSGSVTIIGKVRPEDVFAVPERNTNKMRVCGYHILGKLPSAVRSAVNSGRPMDSVPEGKVILENVLRGNHIGVTQYVEIGGNNGSNLTITDVEGVEAVSLSQAVESVTAETLDTTKDSRGEAKVNHITEAPVKATDLIKPVTPKAAKVTKTKVATKVKAKAKPAKAKQSDGDKPMSVKEQAQHLYQVFKETKKQGDRANTKDAAQELQFFMSSRKKGPKAFGLDPKVSDELKTWLK